MIYQSFPLGQSQDATSPRAAESMAGRPTPRPASRGLAAAFKRWLARFIEARDRRAAIHVLRCLDERIPHAMEPDRTYMLVIADALRRGLR